MALQLGWLVTSRLSASGVERDGPEGEEGLSWWAVGYALTLRHSTTPAAGPGPHWCRPPPGYWAGPRSMGSPLRFRSSVSGKRSTMIRCHRRRSPYSRPSWPHAQRTPPFEVISERRKCAKRWSDAIRAADPGEQNIRLCAPLGALESTSCLRLPVRLTNLSSSEDQWKKPATVRRGVGVSPSPARTGTGEDRSSRTAMNDSPVPKRSPLSSSRYPHITGCEMKTSREPWP